MKTHEQMQLELGKENYMHVLGLAKVFMLDHGLGKLGTDSAWRATLEETQSTLPEPLRPYFSDMVNLAITKGAN